MRLRGERGARRARLVVDAFRPRGASGAKPPIKTTPRVILTGFAAFPGVPRNATADMIRALADIAEVELRVQSFRSRDFAVGRGSLRLPSGTKVHVSLMVLPVVWEAAAALVAKEARAARASLVVMSGVGSPVQPLFVETYATSARVPIMDAFGLSPHRRTHLTRQLRLVDADAACEAAREALAHEKVAVHGVERRDSRGDNAYVCNVTAYTAAQFANRTLRVLKTSTRPQGIEVRRSHVASHGFLHWPRDVAEEDAPACARVLLAFVDALIVR